jgi:hypothetical protein
MTLEERGAYAALSAYIVNSGIRASDVVGDSLCGSKRKWKRLKAALIAQGAINVLDDGSVMVVALANKLYKTGYLHTKASIPSRLRWQVFRRDGYACCNCSAKEDLTVDHIVSELNGGETELENLRTLCRPCNSSKGAK